MMQIFILRETMHSRIWDKKLCDRGRQERWERNQIRAGKTQNKDYKLAGSRRVEQRKLNPISKFIRKQKGANSKQYVVW